MLCDEKSSFEKNKFDVFQCPLYKFFFLHTKKSNSLKTLQDLPHLVPFTWTP